MTRATVAVALVAVACGGARPATTSRDPQQAPAAAPVAPVVRCSEAAARGEALRGVWLRGTTHDATCESVAARAGAQLDEEAVDRDVRALFGSARFDDVVAIVESDLGGPRLVYELTERAPVERVEVVGESPGTNLRQADFVLAFVDHAAIHRLSASLVEALRSQGYRRATVTPRIRAGTGVAKIVQFAVTPGARTVLGDVTFVGLSAAREAAARQRLTVVPSAPVASADADRDVLAVSMALQEQGLLASTLTYRFVEDPTRATVDLVIEVTEGDVFTFGSVRAVGPRAREARAYTRSLAPLHRGAVARRSALQAARAAIEALHAGDAPPVTVDLLPRLDTTRRIVDVDYVVR